MSGSAVSRFGDIPPEPCRTAAQISTDLPEADFQKLLSRCRALPAHRGDYASQPFLSNVILTVLDYQLHNTVVKRAHERFVREHCRAITDIYRLADFLGRYSDDKQGNTEAAMTLWGYRHWTRLAQLRGLVSYFISIGVVDAQSLREWATAADFKQHFSGRIKGLGPAVFQWLVMRAGVETIKPDVHVMNFVSGVLGYSPGFQATINALVRAARVIGMSPRELDWAIWEHQRGSPGEI